MSISSLALPHLSVRSAEDIFEIFRRLGYPVLDPEPFEGPDLDDLELDEADAASVERAYIVSDFDGHTVYLYEVNDLHTTRLRGLAWNARQRGGTALLIVTRDYREVIFVHPRFAGPATTKSNIRVDKLKMVTSDPTRHDLDTLNTIHAHRRTGQQIYDAQGEAFNVTKITDRFYREYKDHYNRVRDAVRQYNRQPEFQNADQEAKLHAFTQRLLGRLMFLYFLQRKGWLGGRLKFLTEQFADTVRRHAGEFRGDQETFYYYAEVLEPLFFETMNTRRPDNITRWPGIRIPYLNGGLFDQSRDPDGVIVLPDSLFDPMSNTGLLAFFNRYNFTIADDTPLEQDVAVDPEMLGKVFENMLEERERGQTGSFYTPRTIVAYMCQEALAGYLEESAGIPRDTTRAQFDPDRALPFTADEARCVAQALDTLTVLDPAVGSGSFPIGMLGEIIRLRRACAEALGQDVTPASVADWKEAIIRDTLYGVDIKPEAIEIAQLRLWLALVVDQTIEQARPLPNLDYKLMAGDSLIETIDGKPVLTESAQALLSTTPDGVTWEHTRDQLKLFDPNPVQARMVLFDSERQTEQERLHLDKLRQQYFRATPDERRRLREEITAQERRIVFSSLKEQAEELQEQIDQFGHKAGLQNGVLRRDDQRKLEAAAAKLKRITEIQETMRKPDASLPFFLYRLHFSEVFAAKGGFDIVIANPPYVRMESIKDLKTELEMAYLEVYSGRADLYVYFYARGIQLVRPHGQLAYITSNKWLQANYGIKLRRYLSEHVQMNNLVDFGELPVFDASTFPLIFLASKSASDRSLFFTQVTSLEPPYPDIRELVSTHRFEVTKNSIRGANWLLADDRISALLKKMLANGSSLGDYLANNQIYYGIKTGRNEVYVISDEQRADLVREDNTSEEIIKPLAVGTDIRKWHIEHQNQYLIYAYHGVNIDRYSAIKSYLTKHRELLSNRATVGLHEWYELQQPQIGMDPRFTQAKIVYPIIASSPRFTLDTQGYYVNDKCFVIMKKDMYLLGILNSWAAWENLKHICSVLGDPNRGGRLELRSSFVNKLPIPDAPDALRQRIASLAQQCLDAAQASPDRLPALEAELNALVYEAYGLDTDDIAVIEESLKG